MPQTCLLPRKADVCLLTQQAWLLCGTADMSSVWHSRQCQLRGRGCVVLAPPENAKMRTCNVYVYTYIYIYCPFRGYSEGLLAEDKRPMGCGQFLAKPKAKQGSETFASRWGPALIPSAFVTGLQPIWYPRCGIVTCLQRY